MPRYDDSTTRSSLAGMRDRRRQVQQLLNENEMVRKQCSTRRFGDSDKDDGKAIGAHSEAHLLLTNRRLIYFPDEGAIEEFPFSTVRTLTEKERRRDYVVIEIVPASGDIQHFVVLPFLAKATGRYFRRFEKVGSRPDVLERLFILRKKLFGGRSPDSSA